MRVMEKAIDILEHISSALDRKDEAPNVELAIRIVDSNDTQAIEDLVQHLSAKRAIQNNCIKVLYEIGERNPVLIAPYLTDFLALLSSKNNRLQWGGMTALACISQVEPAGIYAHLTDIVEAASKGSVISRDQAVNILIRLSGNPEYGQDSFELLLEQLRTCPTNQLPMYAERALPVIGQDRRAAFVSALEGRLPEVEKESKRKRIEKVIRRLSKS